MLRFIRFYGKERYIQNTKSTQYREANMTVPLLFSPSIFGISAPPLRQNGESFKQTNSQSRYTIPASKRKRYVQKNPVGRMNPPSGPVIINRYREVMVETSGCVK